MPLYLKPRKPENQRLAEAGCAASKESKEELIVYQRDEIIALRNNREKLLKPEVVMPYSAKMLQAEYVPGHQWR